MAVEIHAPGALPEGVYDRDKFIGTWNVAWSTLPMWRKNRDVTITYKEDGENMASDVGYRARTSPAAGLSHVRGTERLQPGTTGTFVWRGDSWLFWCTSRWEVRGMGSRGEVEWSVITFEKTLFTPRGVDVLVRGGERAGQNEVVADVLKALESVEDIRAMAFEGEEVPR